MSISSVLPIKFLSVVPEKAGTQEENSIYWIPAFAGMTME